MSLATIGVSRAATLAKRAADEAYYAAVCARAGVFGIEPPLRVLRLGLAVERYGVLGSLTEAAALRHPDGLAISDEQGELTWRELDDRVNALASAWRDDGFRAGDGVALLARNHRGLIEAMFAAAKLGGKIILMNTGFSGPQIREVADREGVDLIVYDEEYTAAIGDYRPRLGTVRAWVETRANADDTLEAQIASSKPTPPPRPGQPPRLVILTSGTTGTPKGAGRHVPLSLSPIGGPLSRVPYRSGQIHQICAPIFHALGFSQMILAVSLNATMVIHRRFDPQQALESMAENRVNTVVMVPVMLQRMMALDDAAFESRDLSALRIVFVSGSALSADLARRTLDRLGPVLYNLYGSTEVAYATIATPADLTAAPGTVGRVVHGATVKILAEDGAEQPVGKTGRIFVANTIQFEGYTGGGHKEIRDGLMSSGDVGHFDESGRLFIDGRDDDMIVSGGENVFPHEVEELLAGHPAVAEAAAIGVEDDEFGQRLKAFVALRSGKSVDADTLRAYVKDNLANYKVPREIVFLDALPRNPTGKVLKRELRDR
ncbi:acyl-CoA synthetase [Conexibacter sp. DBS9H8]|uniref:acyl-CoA synthetase n=1 Tax=Conexibacter sp. DBS9H8 TaxID=2937801 RepID=UPI00200F4214|nr:acyl-CoA synthetase [Conexibacter sp. DBS9H8]